MSDTKVTTKSIEVVGITDDQITLKYTKSNGTTNEMICNRILEADYELAKASNQFVIRYSFKVDNVIKHLYLSPINIATNFVANDAFEQMIVTL